MIFMIFHECRNYDGVEINTMDAEDSLWDRYVEYCREQGITPQDDADYDKWIAETGEAEGVLMDLAAAQD